MLHAGLDPSQALEGIILGLGQASEAIAHASETSSETAKDESRSTALGTIQLQLEAALKNGAYPWNFYLPAHAYDEKQAPASWESPRSRGNGICRVRSPEQHDSSARRGRSNRVGRG
jgi:hypothetical protein